MICYTKVMSKNDIRKWEIDEHVPNWSNVYGPVTTGFMKSRIYDAEETLNSVRTELEREVWLKHK